MDATTIKAAARYGITITPPDPAKPRAVTEQPCSPDGMHCATCNGTHNPTPGVAFITARDWWTQPA
jgi:hypothetical protein